MRNDTPEKRAICKTAIFVEHLAVAAYILINELGVIIFTSCVHYASYELIFAYLSWITVYCMSYEFLFTYESRVDVYCSSYKSLLLLELRVISCIQVTSYILLHELRVTF